MSGIQKLYADLEELLQTGWENPRVVNNKIQKKLLEIEKYKKRQTGSISAGLAGYVSGLYPDIRDINFNQELTNHPLVKQYTKNITSRELAERVYKTYMNIGKDNGGTGAKAADKKTFADPETVISQDKVQVFIHSNIQKMLRNFMSPRTPYRGLLICHGTGVGKTCTSITIAEALKDFELAHNVKIHVIRPDEFKRQIFDRNAYVAGKPQCTGDTYPDAISEIPTNRDALIGCQKGVPEDCGRVDREVRKEIKKYYEFSTNFLWAKKVFELIRNKTRGLEGLEKHQKMVATIRHHFNNSVLIIDEAHTFRNMGSSANAGADDVEKEDTAANAEIDENMGSNQDDRLISTMINKVLTYSQNMRVILLTATPMYDRPQDIIPLLNYLLLNDKRPSVSEKDIFEIDGTLKDRARLIDISRGYVSYVRGNDPNNFPLRLTADYNLSGRSMFNPEDYPKRDILGRPVEKKVKHFKLVKCPMAKEQQDVLLGLVGVVVTAKKDEKKVKNSKKGKTEKLTDEAEVASRSSVDDLSSLSGDSSVEELDVDIADKDINDPNFSVAFNSELQASNVIFKTLEETSGTAGICYGRIGFANCFQKIPGQQAYRFRDDEHARRFMTSGLLEFAPKLYHCLQNIEKSQGPAFVYSYYIAGGILPMAFALELAGYTRYGGEKPLLESKYKPSGPSRGEYILYIGSKQLSRGANKFLDLRQGMIHEKNVRVVLASQKGSVGLNLFGFREIHILDPWHNVNLIEQTIGRVIRTESHAHLPPEKRNVVVYQYATVLDGAYKDRESIDLRVYAICESKAVKSGQVELALKENAIDCVMNKPLNYRAKNDYSRPIDIVTSHGLRVKYNLWDEPYSRDSLYMANSNYKCLAGTTIGDSDKQKTANRILGKDLDMYKLELGEIISIIQSRIKKHYNLMSLDVWHIISEVLHLDKSPDERDMAQNIFAYLADYFAGADINLLDLYGRESKIVVLTQPDGGFILRLVPLTEFNPSLPIANQQKYGVEANKPEGFYFSKHMVQSKTDEKKHIFTEEPVGGHPVEAVHINPLVQTLRREKLKLIDKEELNYGSILMKLKTQIDSVWNKGSLSNEIKKDDIVGNESDYGFETNIKIKSDYGFNELHKLIFDRQLFVEKLYLLQNLVAKIKCGEKLSQFETMLVTVANFNLVSKDELFKSGISAQVNFIQQPDELYGFLIARYNKLTLYRYDSEKTHAKYDELHVKDLFTEDKAKYATLLDKRWRSNLLDEGRRINSLFGYMVYTKSDTLPPVFKITDYLTKGYKKSVKGVSCSSKNVPEIIQYIKIIEPAFKEHGFKYSKIKKIVCGDLEIFFRVANNRPDKRYFLGPEEYAIWQSYQE